MNTPALAVSDLRIGIRRDGAPTIDAVEGVSFTVAAGQVLAIDGGLSTVRI